jgi:hypothetical protein
LTAAPTQVSRLGLKISGQIPGCPMKEGASSDPVESGRPKKKASLPAAVARLSRRAPHGDLPAARTLAWAQRGPPKRKAPAMGRQRGRSWKNAGRIGQPVCTRRCPAAGGCFQGHTFLARRAEIWPCFLMSDTVLPLCRLLGRV